MIRKIIHWFIPLKVRVAIARLWRHNAYKIYADVYTFFSGETPPPPGAGREVSFRGYGPKPELMPVTFEKHVDDLPILPEALIGCRRGLYHLKNDKVHRLVTGDFYGLTRHADWWYIAQRLHSGAGRLYRFKLNEDRRIHSWQKLFKERLGGIHQIDFIGDRLYAAIANSNAIYVFDEEGHKLGEYYPVGKLENGRASPNYAHLNSVFGANGKIYVVAMNITYQTGKRSQLLILDQETMQVEEIIEDVGNCSHDVLLHQDMLLICNSMEGKLRNHNQPVITFSYYLRGLAVNDQDILVGRSEWVADRRERTAVAWSGYLYRLNYDFELLESITLEGCGQIQSIRFMENEYGLSNTASP